MGPGCFWGTCTALTQGYDTNQGVTQFVLALRNTCMGKKSKYELPKYLSCTKSESSGYWL